MRIKYFTLATLLAGAVTACGSDTTLNSAVIDGTGSGGDSGDNSGNNSGNSSGSLIGSVGEDNQANTSITHVGLIKLEPNNISTDFSRGLFGRLTTPLSAAEVSRSYAPQEDFCEVYETDNTILPGPVLRIYEQQATLLSAGENLTLSGDSGTLATLNRFDVETGPYYRPDVAIGRTAQNGLLIDIPGDQFPQFASVPFNNVPALQVTSPATDALVTGSTQFSWNAHNITGSVFELYSGGIAGDGSSISITCTLIDDGSFTFPESTLALIGDYQADWTGYLRIAYNAVIQGDAVVFTANSVAPD